MRKVIVTGATSYIAAALIRLLLEENYFIYAVIRPSSANQDKLPQSSNLSVIELDMDCYSELGAMDLGGIDAVYHFAWEGVRGGCRTDNLLQSRNMESTKQLLDVACRRKIPYFIGMGSQAEYGITGRQLITEDMPLNPVDAYGAAKKYIYQYGTALASRCGFTFIWARIFSAYGYGEHPDTLIMSSMRKMMCGKDVELSPCEHLWDYLYRDDLAQALYHLLKCQSPGGAYNISYGCPHPLKHYMEQMKKVLNSNSRLLFGVIPYGQHIVQMNPSIAKICSITTWSPETDFETGIRRIYKDMENEKDKHLSTNL